MSSPASAIKLNGLERSLVSSGVLDESQAVAAREHISKNDGSLITHLLDKKLASASDIAHAASREYGIPSIDLDAFDQAVLPLEFVNEKLCMKHNAIPLFKRGNRLFVAISDPMNLVALDEIKFNTGYLPNRLSLNKPNLKK